MLEKKSEEILGQNDYLNKRKMARKHIKFNKDKKAVFFLAFLFSIIVLIIIYFISPFSDVYKVVIKGNYYLKTNDVIKMADVNNEYLLNIPSNIQNNLETSPLIKEAIVSLENNKIISIEIVEEKMVGYIFEDEKLYILMINDEKEEVNDENIYLIDNVPLIEGYTKEELKEIERGFENTSIEVIKQISEIHKYPVSYDDKQMEVIMKDGNYCFMSYLGLSLLENYYAVSSSIDKTKGHACIYFDEFTNSAYTSICPWQASQENQ